MRPLQGKKKTTKQRSYLGKDEIKTRKDDETFWSSWPVRCVCICVCVWGGGANPLREWQIAEDVENEGERRPSPCRTSSEIYRLTSNTRIPSSILGVSRELKPIEIYHRTNWQTKPPLIPAVYTLISVCWSYPGDPVALVACNSRGLMELIVPGRAILSVCQLRRRKERKKERERERERKRETSTTYDFCCFHDSIQRLSLSYPLALATDCGP